MNKITQKEYQEQKNQDVTVFSFDNVTGKRTMCCSHMSLFQAINEVKIRQYYGNTCLIVEDEQRKKIDREESESKCGFISIKNAQKILLKEDQNWIKQTIENVQPVKDIFFLSILEEQK